MKHKIHKEIGVDLLGVNALDPYFENTSASRKAMFSTQIGQAPIVDGNTPRRIFTGVESIYGKNTFNVKLPCDATILKVIRKYPVGMGQSAIRHNPITVILYEDYYDPHKTIGVLEVPDHYSFHQEFGFQLKKDPAVWNDLAPGSMIEKGTVLAQSKAVRANGQYGMGLEAQVVFMSKPGTIEDGFEVSKSFLARMQARTYSTLVGNWGRKTFPLNLYGTDTHYKPFPDIGDKVRDDGMVFALREIDDDLGVAEMTPRALRTVDYGFDRPLFGKPGARVVDVSVYHDDRVNPSYTPVGMDLQARKYYDLQVGYYQSLMDEYRRLQKRRGATLKITPELNRLLVEAQMFLPVAADRRKLTRMHRLEQLDEWRVEVTYEKKLQADNGYKFTDLHGGN